MDLSHLKSLLNNDQSMVDKFMKIFKTETPQLVQNLEKCIQAGNLTDAEIAAHSLKSQVRYIGLEKEGRLAAEIEDLCRQEGADKILTEKCKVLKESILTIVSLL